jgi:hypothetical protein
LIIAFSGPKNGEQDLDSVCAASARCPKTRPDRAGIVVDTSENAASIRIFQRVPFDVPVRHLRRIKAPAARAIRPIPAAQS